MERRSQLTLTPHLEDISSTLSLGDRLQRMENTTATMKEKWCRGDEAMRDFTGTWIRNDLEISDDFGAFWRYLEQAPEMTIELDHRSILKRNNRSMFMS
ncbi:hypothetical protein F2Q69_00053427 [Brassica cretica]|uniref:Uncharacterized protein n=1 Tax=Brassica cretica TaxID=69181 RepID=A0A8S9N6F6_BRACR|nr:hypothetical protein F2Q69_00053427 [Brassica cretica]